MEISFQTFRISFLLDVALSDLHVRDDGKERIGAKRAIIDLNFSDIIHRRIAVEGIELDGGNVDLAISESTEEDTTASTPIPLSIDIKYVKLANCNVSLDFSTDSTSVKAAVKQAYAEGGDINLKNGVYDVRRLSLEADSVRYSDFVVYDIGIEAEKIFFRQSDTYITADIKECRLRESHGAEIEHLSCSLLTDSTRLRVDDLSLKTPYSNAEGNAFMHWSAVKPNGDGKMEAKLQARIGHEDMRTALTALGSTDIAKALPEQPLAIELDANGNIDSLDIQELQVSMPKTIDLRVCGNATDVTDSLSRGADIDWDLRTGNLSFVQHMFGLHGIRIPALSLTANTCLRNAKKLSVDALLQEGQGKVKMTAKVDFDRMAYNVKARIANMQAHHFLPSDSIRTLSASVSAEGEGTDLLSARTRLKALAKIDRLDYRKWNVDSMDLQASLKQGNASVEINSDNELLKLQACADATLKKRKLEASSFSMDLSHIDLYALHLAKDTLSASMVMHVEGSSDFRQTHRMYAKAEALELVLKDTVFHPVELCIDADLTPDYVQTYANAGDMKMSFSSPHGLDSLLTHCDVFMKELKKETDSLRIRQDTLQTLLPEMKLEIQCGQRNPVSNILKSVLHYTYSDLALNFSSSPSQGISSKAYLHKLNTGSVLLDTIDWDIQQKEEGVCMDMRVKNGPKNKVVVFESTLHATLTPTGAAFNLDFTDSKGKKGVDVGMEADIVEEGAKFHFTPLNPIIAYRNFTLNEDNFISLSKEGRLEALIDLLADDGTGVKIYSTPNEDALQDISLSMNRVNIGELCSVMPYMPEIQGLLHGDFHYMQSDSTVTVSADMDVKGMKYEDTPMGDIGLSAVYFPNSDGSHFVDGIVKHNDNEVVYVSGKYLKKNENGTIDAEASLERLPLSLADAFLPEGLARLEGYAKGNVTVQGQASSPQLDGKLTTDSLYILSDDYNVRLSLPDANVNVDKSRITLDHIKAYAAGKTPLDINGTIDMANFGDPKLDITLTADNYQLINAPKTHNALAYGKAFVDLRTRVWGSASDMRMRGKLNVLGNTDLYYVLKDSPVTVEDQLADIVTFCDFSDTVKAEPVEVSSHNIDMQLTVNVEQAALVHCILSDDGSDYINLQGGGELNMTYDLLNELRLFGRYTIQEGVMKYSIMAVPLNDFKIQEGSYVEFHGDVMNPQLSIKATERVKASVSESGTSHNVAFNVGLALSQTLDDMGLEFTLEAPEDMSVQNELTAMSAEDRGRVAVTMLVTGMYLANESNVKGGFSYANTLNTYLQTAINNIAGQALNSADVNVGIENKENTGSGSTTDYSFSFAKRFWGNRFSVIIGGKVSTGKEAVNNGQTIIDNISVEYRLDKNSTRYVRLYYDRNYESLLEGELTEMGAGLVLRRKTEKLGDLFLFRDRKKNNKQEVTK